jgi:hypothetical protein
MVGEVIYIILDYSNPSRHGLVMLEMRIHQFAFYGFSNPRRIHPRGIGFFKGIGRSEYATLHFRILKEKFSRLRCFDSAICQVHQAQMS